MSTRIATDANDQLVYTFDEADAPFLNSGSGGSANLTRNGTVVANQTGLFTKSVRFPGDSVSPHNYLKTADNIAEVAYPVTLSCWSFGIALGYWGGTYGSWGGLIIKQRATGTWAYPPPAPNAALALRVREYSADGISIGLKTVGDTNTVWWLVGPGLRTYSWNHIGMTYDGAYVKAYINGRLVLNTAKTGAIDYGAHGQWVIGATPGSEKNFNGYEITNCGLCGYVDDVRVASVIRSASWFSDVWTYGSTVTGGIQPKLPPIMFPAED
jgi:hypothetical protein